MVHDNTDDHFANLALIFSARQSLSKQISVTYSRQERHQNPGKNRVQTILQVPETPLQSFIKRNLKGHSNETSLLFHLNTFNIFTFKGQRAQEVLLSAKETPIKWMTTIRTRNGSRWHWWTNYLTRRWGPGLLYPLRSSSLGSILVKETQPKILTLWNVRPRARWRTSPKTTRHPNLWSPMRKVTGFRAEIDTPWTFLKKRKL